MNLCHLEIVHIVEGNMKMCLTEEFALINAHWKFLNKNKIFS